MHSQCLGQGGNMAVSLHKFTVQEAANAVLPRLIEVNATTTTADYDDNDVIFNWVEVPNVTRTTGGAVQLVSASALLPAAMGDRKAKIQLVFAQGIGSTGTEPAALGTLDSAVSISRADAQAGQICGTCIIGGGEDDLVASNIASNATENLGLIMAPESASKSLWVAGIARAEPAAAFTDTVIKLYLGFYG